MHRGFVVVAFLGSLTFAAVHTTGAAGGQAQVSATPAGLTIAGRVLTAENDAVLRRARVEVSSGGRRFDTVLTDDDGRFASEVTGPGPFVLSLSKAGYVLTTITLSRDEALRPLDARLSRGAAIGGRVVDQRGQPALGVAVNARLLDAAAKVEEYLSTATDDRGEFRLGGLPSGRYQVVVSSVLTRARLVDGNPPRTVIEQLRGAAVGPAQTLLLRAGDDLSNVDFEMTVAERETPPSAILLPTVAEPVLPKGTAGRIRGRVVFESGQPNVPTVLRLSGPGGERPLTTGPDGQFSIAGLRAGVYTLNTAAGGGLGVSAQQSSRTVALREDEDLDGVELLLPRGGAITGTVVDEHGEPVQGARVSALLVQDKAGRLVAERAGGVRRTDDRGRYRLYGLPPGTYIIGVSLDASLFRSGRDNSGYAPLYYPGTPVLGSATPVQLAGDADGVHMTVAPVSTVRVRGGAVDGAGPLVAGTARLLASRSGSIVHEGETVPIGADGAFAFSNVPPGDYVVQVVGAGPGRTGLFGRATVAVADAEPAPLTIETSRGSTLEGRFVVEGEPEPGLCMRMTRLGASVNAPCPEAPTFTLLPIPLEPDVAFDRAPSVVRTGTTFWVTGLFGRTAFALRGAPSDSWRLKSISIGGLDVTDRFDFGETPQTIDDAEVVFTRASGTIAGRIDRERDALTRDYAVVVFPTDRQLWFPGSRWTKFTRSARDGSFRVSGLPAGDYFIAAVDDLAGTPDAGEWQRADVLTTLAASSIRASVVENESRTVVTRLIRRAP
jgi:hypothetical protein